ncbi:uncharacterized protein HHUB_4086 (plasmid) [Halobacterium hubeiense]|uniref:Halobacterial output domain-containing protein n=1 Tax=Halobacterium hubeiense TaxID=1407499 RepID=A0A0U5H636_9EURY|nr:HalOD1 output domain-containing protein [Halobacterium hubeiense]CQH63454.1 uncharacterized protein HHUB_4086 [Halobacterium hubeiense]
MEYEIEDDESVSMAVVRAVTAVTGCSPGSTPLLARVVDPDALDALFSASFDGTPRTGGHLTFVYADCRVTIDNGEFLTVRPLRTAFGGAADEPPTPGE